MRGVRSGSCDSCEDLQIVRRASDDGAHHVTARMRDGDAEVIEEMVLVPQRAQHPDMAASSRCGGWMPLTSEYGALVPGFDHS